MSDNDLVCNAAAAGTGVATGLVGTLVPLVGLGAGLAMQMFRFQAGTRYEYAIEGITDGSAALVGRMLAMGSRTYPQVCDYPNRLWQHRGGVPVEGYYPPRRRFARGQWDDSDALAG